MNSTDAIKRLGELCQTIERTQASIRRKRNMRPSEKAMSLGSYEQDKEAVRLGIAALMKVGAVALALALSPATAKAQVECYRTGTPAEVVICENPELARTDAEAASIFDELYQASRGKPMQADLAASEHRWIAERNTCGLDRLCIEVSYRSHIEYLCGLLLQAQGQHDACQNVRQQ